MLDMQNVRKEMFHILSNFTVLVGLTVYPIFADNGEKCFFVGATTREKLDPDFLKICKP